VGSYDSSKPEAITPRLSDPLNKLSNYTVSSTSAILTIAPAALTATANAGTKIYGTANPVFTGQLTGVIPGDGITATYLSSATTSTVVGTYDASRAEAITPVLADPNSN